MKKTTEPDPLHIVSGEAKRQSEAAAAGMCRAHRDTPAHGGTSYCSDCLDRRAAAARERYTRHRSGFREVTRTYTCSICGGKGHGKRTCQAGPLK